MRTTDIRDDFHDIGDRLYMYELRSIFLHSREPMEVLDEVLTSFHHSFPLFPLPEELSMSFHRIEYLSEGRLVVSWKETPRITEACSSDHEAIEIFRLCHCEKMLLFL